MIRKRLLTGALWACSLLICGSAGAATSTPPEPGPPAEAAPFPPAGPPLRPYEKADMREVLRRQLYDVVFWDSQRGWAVGGGGTILITTNGGRTWRRQKVGSRNIYGVGFVGERQGWAVGERGLLLYTRTAGATWGIRPVPAKGDLNAVQFANPQVGWIVGDDGVILATQDGGRNWNPQQAGVVRRLRHLACFSLKGCIVVGQAGTVLTTDDGGKTWTQRLTPAGGSENEAIFRVMIARDGTAWAVGGSAKRNYLLRSDDRGRTWTVATYEPPEGPVALFFWDAKKGVVASFGVALTVDGGATWITARIPRPSLLQALFFIDEHVGWAVGDEKSIFHTQDGGKTWHIQYDERRRRRP